jgi:UDP-N-acetylmuramyl pentapeptide phosphotransferase/UDP-N-acetylglucosamine-1-phosphate transferase
MELQTWLNGLNHIINKMLQILVYFSVSIIVFLLTLIFRKIAINKSIIDNPNERSSHTLSTPRGGGLSIALLFYLSIMVLFLTDSIDNKLFLALLSGIPLLIISLMDDVVTLSPKIRIIIQLISSSLALYFLGGLHIFDLGFIKIEHVWILTPFALIGIIWFINLYNFIDGIDGYASMEAIFVSSTMYFITKSEVFAILSASVLGFIPLNWQRAKIFMGDVGSTLLGFFIVICGIYFQNEGDFSLLNWTILTSLFWFDATITIIRRWSYKEKLSVAHRNHAYQRTVQSGFSHQKTVIFGFMLNLCALALVLFNLTLPKLSIIGFMLQMVILTLTYMAIERRKAFTRVS